ncbi:carboxypeptidase-like regulatory domain-containing protein [Arenibacter antarcticus]
MQGTTIVTTKDEGGYYILKAPAGSYPLNCKSTGYKTAEKTITINSNT